MYLLNEIELNVLLQNGIKTHKSYVHLNEWLDIWCNNFYIVL